MALNLIIEGIIHDCIFRERYNDKWNDYKTKIIRNIEEIDFQKKIENYKPCCNKYLYVSRQRMIDILYKDIVSNNKIFEEIFCNGYYPKKGYDITGNDIWGLVEICMNILTDKQKLK